MKKTFTYAGVDEVWRQKHAKEIQELTTINASLSDEDRAKAMVKLEKDIKRAVVVKVAGNYGAAALVTTAVVGEGLLIGNYKGWADTLAKKRYVGFIGQQAKWARRGIDGLIGKIASMGKGIKKSITNPSLSSESSLSMSPIPLDLDQVILNAPAEKLHEINDALKNLNKKYNLSKILPNGLTFSLGGDPEGLYNLQAESVAKVIIEQALALGGEVQPLFFAKGKDGSMKWMGNMALKQGWWDETLQVFQNKNMAEVVDLGRDTFALVVNNNFIDYIKSLAVNRG